MHTHNPTHTPSTTPTSPHLYFGHNYKRPKSKEATRIMFLNIGTFPRSHKDNKNNILRETINKINADIIGLSETNTNWNLIEAHNSIYERTRTWWPKLNVRTSHNTQNTPTPHQYGGTATITLNQTTSAIQETGGDFRQLGRWNWVRFRGKHGITLRVITAYKPNKPTNSAIHSTYAQQAQYLSSIGITTSPIQQFQVDLIASIRRWKSVGDQIVLLIDANQDVTSNSDLIAALNRINITESIFSQHQYPPVATQNRNNSSTPIDSIFTSPTILITKSGASEFIEGLSDHRAMWIEFKTTQVLGQPLHTIPRPYIRRLRTDDPRTVHRYTTTLLDTLRTHKITTRILALEQSIKDSHITKQQINEFETLDSLLTAAMKSAEASCRKLHMGAVPFSPPIQKAIRTIWYWRLILQKKSGKRIGIRRIIRLKHQCNIEGNSLDLPLHTIRDQLKKARTAYHNLKKTASTHRTKWIEALATAKALQNGGAIQSHLIQLLHRENQRAQSHRVKLIHRQSDLSVKKVVENTNTGPIEHTTKSNIEKAILRTNKAKFEQSHNTPFLQQPLISQIGLYGTTKAADSILLGTYTPPPSLDDHTKTFIKYLKADKIHKHNPPPSLIFTTAQYQARWKHKKESTSSSMSNRHIGHYKAIISNNILSDCFAAMANIPFRTGYSPKRWRSVLDLQLMKKVSDPAIDKQRTISLLEADFNNNNGRIAAMCQHLSTSLHQRAPEQYGGVKGKKAILQSLNKVLTYDIHRQLRQPMILCSNDAKSCFDRIVHSVAMLCLRRLGLPIPPILSMMRTFQHAKHYIRTSHGDSSRYLSSSPNSLPIQGVVQGNQFATDAWDAVSTVLLHMLRKEGFGFKMLSSLTQEALHIVGFAFIDDMDLVQSSIQDGTLLHQIVPTMQSMINLWEGGLRASGGALVPHKSFFYAIDFDWAQGRWSYTDTSHVTLHMKDHNGNTTDIENIPIDTAKETLGTWIAPNGSMTQQADELYQKADKWADEIQASFARTADVYQSLRTKIMKSIEYPLPATTLTRTECDHIMKPILNTGLPRSGICRKLKRDVVHGPIPLLGLGINHPYHSQGAAHVITLLTHLHKDDTTGRLLRASHETMSLELGSNRSPLTHNFDRCNNILTFSWLHHTWQYIHEQHITITNLPSYFPPKRENDVCLMDKIISTTLSNRELESFNICRIYLKLIHLSDILDGNGTHIIRTLYSGQRRNIIPSTNNSALRWPHQDTPTSKDWTIWRKGLKLAFNITLTSPSNIQLGEWITVPPNWKWFYDEQSVTLYRKASDGVWQLKPSPLQRSLRLPSIRFFYTGITTLPPTASPCTIRVNNNTAGQRITGYANIKQPQPPPTLTLQQSCLRLPPSASWIYQSTTWPDDNGITIATDITQNKALAHCDGGFKVFSTNGWQIEASTGNDNNSLTTSMEVPTPHTHTDEAYRSELGGIYAILITTQQICKVHSIHSGSLTISCDCEPALHNSFSTSDSTFQSKHHDLLNPIRHLITSLPITISYIHTAGHQDRLKPTHQLTHNEIKNVEMDNLATLHNSNVARSPRLPYNSIYSPTLSIHINNKQLTTDITKAILHHAQAAPLLNYWDQKHILSLDTNSLVDWNALDRALKTIPTHRQHWLTKWVTQECGIGITMKHRKHRHTNRCPLCDLPETSTHILQCTSLAAKTHFQSALSTLCDHMSKTAAPLDFITAIRNNLYAWKTNRNPQPTSSSSLLLITAINDQTQIGWAPFLRGFLALSWKPYIESFLHTPSDNYRKRSLTNWTSSWLRAIWELTHYMWTQRNGILHSPDEIHEFKMEADTDAYIKEQYDRGPNDLLPRDKHLMHDPLSTLLQQSLKYKQTWKERMSNARQISDLQHTTHHNISRTLHQQRQALRSFFTP